MPSLRYQDVGRALDWLSEVFGLREYLRWSSDDSVVHHTEMRMASGFVELASATEEQPIPPALSGVSSALMVLVDDAESHHERSQASGAKIIAPLQDKPGGLQHRADRSSSCRSVNPRVRIGCG